MFFFHVNIFLFESAWANASRITEIEHYYTLKITDQNVANKYVSVYEFIDLTSCIYVYVFA